MIPAEIPRDGLIHGYKSVFDSLQLVCTINSIHCYSSFGHWCMLFPEFEGVTLYDSRRHDTDSVQFGEVRCNTDDICTRRHLDNIVFLYENLRPPLGTSALNRLDHLSAKWRCVVIGRSAFIFSYLLREQSRSHCRRNAASRTRDQLLEIAAKIRINMQKEYAEFIMFLRP